MTGVHPSAVVEAGAELADAVTVGPFAVIGAGVRIGRGTVVGPHAVLEGDLAIGPDCRIASFAAIGGPPQDLSYAGEPTRVEIGAGVVVRENVTIHRGTARGRGVTIVGPGSYLMAGSHVAHDCVLGEGVIVSNNVLMGGHTVIGDFVNIGGGAAIRQRLRIGAHAFVSGISGLAKDVIPFGYVIGYRGRLDGLNLVGLKRRGFAKEDIRTLQSCYRQLFSREGTFQERFSSVEAEAGEKPLVRDVLAFVRAGPGRPLLTPFEQDDV